MALALDLAARAEGWTRPNPMVGCVLVADGTIVGQGFHERAGEAHAEVAALRSAGAAARGATAYVTLEPCAHTGRTGPCAEALIAAGIARCVIAIEDPFHRDAGRGADRMRAAGIDVSIGVLDAAARRLNEFFLTYVTRSRPFVTAKFAASLDGRIATRTGASRWISSPESRAHAHRLRAIHDVVMVGSGTVLADDPALTARDPEGGDGTPPRQPLRVVLDARLRVPPSARLFDGGTVIVMTAAGADPARRAALEGRGAEVVSVAATSTGIDFGAALGVLHDRECLSVLVEGGATLLGGAMDSGCVDKVVAYIAPRIIGGVAAPAAVAGLGFAALGDEGLLHEVDVTRRGGDIVVTGYC